MNSAEVLIKFNGDTSGVDKSTKNLTTNIGDLTKSITLGNVAAKAITKTFGVLSSNLDSAISRVDTLNNFPRVMSNLGISAEDSAEVIQDLSDKLTGLPTTINDAAMAVQRFTSKNGDVKESEKIFLAVNNAILAGGASSEIQASALEQLSQAYAKGKPDMMEWRTLMTAMPAQLKQVATAMGYVNADALGESLRDGSLSMDEFINTMVKMNSEGVNGFKSFDEQARNATGGIQTSIKNMKTAFVRGVADMISKVNEALEPFGGLSGVIQQVGKVGEKVFKNIGNLLVWIIPKVIKIFKFIANHKNELILIGTIIAGWKIATYIQKGVQAFQMLKVSIALMKMEMASAGGVMAVVKGAMASLNTVIAANPIAIIITAIVALVAAFIYLWNNCEAFRNFFISMWEGIKNVASSIISWFIQAFDYWKSGFKVMLNYVSSFINGFIGLFNTIFNLPSKMVEVGLNIAKGIGKGITSGVEWVKNQIKSFVGNVTKFLKKLFGIHSPSKVMADQVGKYLPRGIAVGIDANTDSVYKAMDNLESGLMTNYDLSPQLTNSSALHYSPSVNVINNVDVSTDPLGQMVSNIKTFSGGARNDYNYGMGA